MSKMLAWLKHSVLEAMSNQANFYQPYETGGCLLGYWVKPLEEVVICEIIGPGPNAKHSKMKFEPDHEWQVSKIATVYMESGYLYSYLGDWHSHPNHSSANLSWQDRRTLRKIASHPPARMPHPLMAIIARDESWVLKIWCLELKDYKIFSIGKKRGFKQIRVYEKER